MVSKALTALVNRTELLEKEDFEDLQISRNTHSSETKCATIA